MVDSPYSANVEVEQSQSQKEVTINDSDKRLAAMMAATHAFTGISGTVTPTFANPTPQWQANMRFTLAGMPGVPFNFDVPSGVNFCKLFIVENNTNGAATSQVTGGGGTNVVVPIGESMILYSDGTDVTLQAMSLSTFLGLLDTPTTYAGSALKSIRVDASGSFLEFGNVESQGITAVAARPGHEGALVNRAVSFGIASGADTSFPWDNTVYDTGHQPDDGGGAQRFFLGPNFDFVDGDVTVGTDEVAETAHGFTTGEGPFRLTTDGVLPAGLALLTDYWAIRIDDDNFKFALNRADALADVDVDITAAAGGGTHTVDKERTLVVPAGVTKIRMTGMGFTDDAGDNNGAIRICWIVKNRAPGSNGNIENKFPGLPHMRISDPAFNDNINIASSVMEVVEGDVFEFYIFNNASGTPDYGGTDKETWFAIEVVDTLELVDAAALGQNMLVNGGFRVAQEGTSFTAATVPNNDDANYTLDQWLFLADEDGGADVADISQEVTDIPNGTFAAIKMLVATANAKFGICQILEERDTMAVVGKTCSLSFKMQTTTGNIIENVRVGILGWTSTADSPTTDPVSGGTWNAEGADPTLATNWAYQNTPADIPPSVDSYVEHVVENVSVGLTVNNLAVFIWVDDTDAAIGDELFISDVRLIPGGTATGFQHEPIGEGLARCERFFQKSFETATNPVQNPASLLGALGYISIAVSTVGGAFVNFRTRMFKDPSITFYNPSAANALWRNDGVGDSGAASELNVGESGFFAEDAGGGSNAAGHTISIHWRAVARL